MIAVDAGAEAVYGCEVSKTMYEVSCDVVTANQMAEHIKLINKKSQHLVIPDDLPDR